MSVLPLFLCGKLSRFPLSSFGLSTVGCELPIFPSASIANLTTCVRLKSFIRNGYKKHGGGGGGVPLFTPHSPFVTSATRRSVRNFHPIIGLLHDSLDTRVGGGYASSEDVKHLLPPAATCPPPSPPTSCPQPSTFNFQLSTFGSFHQPRFTSQDHGSRATGHGSHPHEPAHL